MVQKKSWGVGGGAAPPFANTFVTGSERVHMGSLLVRRYLKLACMVLKKAGGWGGGQPPHLQTPLSRVLRGSIWVLFLLVRRYLKRVCGGLLAVAVS